jgi:16S rRNA (uracil1498-N3)-methyltransferase
MQRFFVPPDSLGGDTVRLEGEVAHQITRVLRMKPGDEVVLLDGLGWEYRVSLVSFGQEEVTGQLLEKRACPADPAHKVTLYLSLLNKPDKFEWALQKCTELGAARFVPMIAERSVASAPGSGKMERWERIIQEAAEQSGRAILPSLEQTVSLGDALRTARADETCIALMPALGADCSVRQALEASPKKVSLFIGPEGGFTEAELEQAQGAGVQLVTLGPRTLRAETAAVTALTVVMYELGEMERPHEQN